MKVGRWSDADSAKHDKIARGEAMESAAALDVLKLLRPCYAGTFVAGTSVAGTSVAVPPLSCAINM